MNQEDIRITIWGVPSAWTWFYYGVFGIQVIVLSAAVIWNETITVADDSPYQTYLAILHNISPGILTIAAQTITAIMAMEGVRVIAEAYLKKRFRDGKAEGIAEGIAEGRAEGIAEGMAEGEQVAHEAWTVWNEKRLDAEARGEPFDEPPPTLNGQNGQRPR